MTQQHYSNTWTAKNDIHSCSQQFLAIQCGTINDFIQYLQRSHHSCLPFWHKTKSGYTHLHSNGLKWSTPSSGQPEDIKKNQNQMRQNYCCEHGGVVEQWHQRWISIISQYYLVDLLPKVFWSVPHVKGMSNAPWLVYTLGCLKDQQNKCVSVDISSNPA